MSTAVQSLLFVGAAAALGVLTWLKLAAKARALLALFIGANIGGWIGSWIATAVEWTADWIGTFGSDLTGQPANAIATAIPAALGLVALIVFGVQMWPKKGKAGTSTIVAAFALPLMWGALVAGFNQVTAGV